MTASAEGRSVVRMARQNPRNNDVRIFDNVTACGGCQDTDTYRHVGEAYLDVRLFKRGVGRGFAIESKLS